MNMKATISRALLGVVAAAVVATAMACGTEAEKATPTSVPATPTIGADREQPIGMANPASVYCIEQGGELETRSDADGNQSGFCIFPDDSEKNQWEYWYENHPVGEMPAVEPGTPVGMANPASVNCLDKGGTLEMRETPEGTAGYCILSDGTVVEEWELWREEGAGEPAPTPIAPPEPFRQYSVGESEGIATTFLLNSATYSFDGIDGTLGLVSTMTLRCPSCWQFTFRFENSTGGYGDRTDKERVEARTPHEAVITVAQGSVAGAVLDGEWDMVFQKGMAAQEESEQTAREYALNTPTYLFDGIEGSLILKDTLEAFCPYCWGFIFVYTSAHPGYGDRTGQLLADEATRHEILVSTSGGAVDGATVDRQWDVVTQAAIRVPEIVTAVAPVEVTPETGSGTTV